MKKLLITIMVILLALSVSGCTKKENKEENKMKMRHISFGTGEKTMVVVPGLTVGYVTDNPQGIEDAFSLFKDEYTVYLFDIRDDVYQGYTIEQMGEDLVTSIKELGLNDIYMYGCSMGGMQTIYVAGKYPELVKKAVVASSMCKANDTSNSVIGNWIELAKNKECRKLTESMGQLIYSDGVYQASKEVFEAMADGLDDNSLARFINTASVIIDLDLSSQAASITCPVLVLGAEGDKVLSSEGSKQIAEITGGQIYMYPHQYPHAVYDEATDFRDRVKQFFDN